MPSDEKRLIPSIHVTIHPTTCEEKTKPEEEVKPSDQEIVEKMMGLKITGGIDFKMPLTVFDVKPKSKSSEIGLKLGDEIITIEGKETSEMTLNDASKELLHACKNCKTFKIKVIRYMDDSSCENLEFDVEGNPKAPRILLEAQSPVPVEAYIQKPERRAWHPVMWPHPEYFLPENYQEELPHKRIVRNVRKLLLSNPSKVEMENLLTALPRGSRPKRNYDDDDD